mmetsp:Transcript_24289/g.62696  ORF Transcript_24289/g.62696 Transcript_24289/m.62696 type:complete len:88 (+) Transcript_24289:74-337(+)
MKHDQKIRQQQQPRVWHSDKVLNISVIWSDMQKLHKPNHLCLLLLLRRSSKAPWSFGKARTEDIICVCLIAAAPVRQRPCPPEVRQS